ncbi:MAG: transcriptional repressor [Gammaproteobacteria bacterium]|nr:transcriptional repressor [Gammaproteobacteria bacterium]
MYNTESRKKILSLFNNDKSKSYTSVDLVNYFKGSIDKSTIYRNLKYLEDEMVIHKILNENTKLYEYTLNDDCHNHFHLKCIRCGKIVHLHCDDASKFISHINEEHDFLISEYMTTLYGLCKECQNA